MTAYQFKKFKKFSNLGVYLSTTNDGNISFKHGKREEVLRNRKRLSKKLHIPLENLWEMEQVHGSQIRILDKKARIKFKDNIMPKTDGLVTGEKNIFLMLKTADCFPLILYDEVAQVIACVHVGWRGAIEKVFLNAILKMMVKFNIRTKNLSVGIGPGRRKCCLRADDFLQEKLPEWDNFINKVDGRKNCDLAGFISYQLINLGVSQDKIEDCRLCTVCSRHFFSRFRAADKNEKDNGRFATIIGMREQIE